MAKRTATKSRKATLKTTEEREVLILRRYLLKKDYAPKGLHRADVVLVVRNDEGKEYTVTLRRNGVHSCSCPAGAHGQSKCYHRDHCIAVENAKIEARKAAKVAQQVVKATQQPVVVSPVPAKVEPAYTMSAEKLAMLTAASQDSAEQTVIVEEPAEPAKDNVTDIGQRGSLNSAQHAASFWEMLPSRKKNIA